MTAKTPDLEQRLRMMAAMEMLAAIVVRLTVDEPERKLGDELKEAAIAIAALRAEVANHKSGVEEANRRWLEAKAELDHAREALAEYREQIDRVEEAQLAPLRRQIETEQAQLLEARDELRRAQRSGLLVELQSALIELEGLKRWKRDLTLAGGTPWFWQGDGEDHLESLTCPILIQPDQLRAMQADLLDARAKLALAAEDAAGMSELESAARLDQHEKDVEAIAEWERRVYVGDLIGLSAADFLKARRPG
jgi:hypothetical protein